MAIADDPQRRWYEPEAPPVWWTVSLAALYAGVSGLRRWLYRCGVLHTRRLPVPVIVVGNIVTGGAGKTPLTIALVEALRAHGYKPGVVSRGYGGSARTRMLLEARSDPALVGDEPALIKSRTGVPVVVGANRCEAAQLLLGQNVDAIIADDGLQHYALARDIEICVIDGMRRLGNGRLLPAGPLREPESRLQSVDFIVCNGGEPRDGEVSMTLAPTDVVAVDGSSRRQPLAAFVDRHVHAVAGIGNPRRFFETLRGQGVDVLEHPFPDHHRYVAADFDFGDDLPVLMTEKDAVKCRAFAQPDWWSVPVSAMLPKSFFDAIAARIAHCQPDQESATRAS
ncbi:MAG: tetraacyldisaccharide 4'-kinase [Rhodanobacteraceae bacterium]|nr:MAG: tetraacyldisaccharide 4'-kinase [Rhodanobacteraceae bacterium]